MEEAKEKNKTWTYLNGNYKENLGIGIINPMYIEINELQDITCEYKKNSKVLK